MKILVTGASGFIGRHITDALISEGHDVTVCVRNLPIARQRFPLARSIQADFTKDHSISDWLPRLKDIDVVINTVGIIRESGGQTFQALHVLAPCALFKACEKLGVKKVIQISALGADETAFSQYHLSKRTADECLMAMGINWVVLRPSIVYGPGAKSMAFFKALAALPLIPVIGKGDQLVQPIHVEDLVLVILTTVNSQGSNNQCVELAGPTAITMKEIYSQLRHWLGLGKARFISIPYRLTLILASVAELFTNAPMTKESIQMLQRGNKTDNLRFTDQFGFSPVSFEQCLSTFPAQQSDRWYAGLYFLRPVLRLSIAFLWIFTGIVSAFIFPLEQSYIMLEKVGVSGIWSSVSLYAAAFIDILLGIALLINYRIRLVGLMQITIIIFYSVIITFTQIEQWIHPFGPISKNIPLIMATLIMIVLEKK